MEKLKRSVKEAERLGVMRQMDKRSINLRQASEELGLCQRQVKRIRKRYLQQGDLGLMSLKKGLRNGNKTPDATREKALSLLRQYFPDFGPTLAQEKLKVCYGIDLSRETIRKWMIVESLWNFKVRRKIKIHQRRTRRSRFGEMLPCDGSHHDWFEGRGGKCCLLLFVDDATSRIVSALFLPTETTEGYLECLEKHLMNYGRPLSIYVDKHSVFRVNQEEFKKGVGITHFGKVLKGLDIELICANSPQAKGRVERKNGVLQDRLVKEMRIDFFRNSKAVEK